MSSIFDKRLLFVTGKGGVGKSTVSAALGVAAARRGKRTMVCEVSQQERLSAVFHRQGVGYHETEIEDNLFAFSIDPERALEEYLLLQIKIKPLYDLMFRNRVFTYFAAATPGMRELVTVGKVWELAQLDRRVKDGAKYDLVIVDAPATGHGLATLRTPKTFGDIARVGPIKKQADTIYEFITTPELTSVCAVAAPEEMPVNETLDFKRRLRDELGLELERIFMNGIYPQLFDTGEIETIERHYESCASNGSGSAVVRRAALRAALAEHGRACSHRLQADRLASEAGQELVELPFLFRPEIDMEAIAELADVLEPAL
jgi:anion-transporting  ArsA/GET3 family ATPase